MSTNSWLNDLFSKQASEAAPAAAPAHTPEDQQKIAEAETFVELLKQAGKKPSDFTNEQLDHLWNEVMVKGASGGAPPPFPPKDDKGDGKDKDEEEKKRKAEEAHAKMKGEKEAAEKIAEFQELGRKAAQAFIEELDKTAAARETNQTKTAAEIDKAVREKVASGPIGKAAVVEGERYAVKVANERKAKNDTANLQEDAVKQAENVSNLNALAAVEALKMAAVHGGYDGEQVERRLISVLEMGTAADYSKTAAAKSTEDAIGNRALELLAACGYPVDWK